MLVESLVFKEYNMQMIRYGKFKYQIDILPCLDVYFHKHFYGEPWHFHITIQWIKWYFEIQLGKDIEK
jgi:hypothetical protein